MAFRDVRQPRGESMPGIVAADTNPSCQKTTPLLLGLGPTYKHNRGGVETEEGGQQQTHITVKKRAISSHEE